MAQFDPRYHDRQRRRWMRPNAHLYMRPDAERWLRPDAARFMRLEAQRDSKSGACDTGARRSDREGWTNRPSLPIRPQSVCDDAADALRSLRWELAKLRLKWAFERWERAQRKAYNPDQPRVPAGSPDGGQWTSGGGRQGTACCWR